MKHQKYSVNPKEGRKKMNEEQMGAGGKQNDRF